MDILKKMFEENRETILNELDVSTKFLSLLTQNGLLDIKDCAEYQTTEDKRARNLDMLTAMTERRTDKAYPLFLQCLQESGQVLVADLLSDMSHEMLAVNRSQVKFYEEIQQMSSVLYHEEGRVGIEGQHTNTDDLEPKEPSVSQSDVLHAVQDSFEEAVKLFNRSKEVIEKLHSDCSSVAALNAEIMSKVKDCDSTVRHLLHANKITGSVKLTPRTAHDMFDILMDDITNLVQYRSKIISKENEERTQSMRLLRLCRDSVDERNTVLKDLHLSISAIQNPNSHVLTGRRSGNNAENLTSSSLETEKVPDSPVQPHPIKTVLEGLTLLELQVREYIHNEVMLTDKYRMELRMKKLKRKSQGYTAHGFANSSQLITCIHNGENVTENVLKLKVILDKVSEEYEECVHYLSRAAKTLQIKENMFDSLTLKNRHDKKNQKKSEMGSFPSLFKKPPEISDEHRVTSTPVPSKNKPLQLPLIIKDHNSSGRIHLENNSPTTSSSKLVDRLKTLVTSYEDLKRHANSLGQKFRQDWERKKREMDNKLRLKEDEVVRLQLGLREITAEKDKFKRLYEQVRIGMRKK